MSLVSRLAGMFEPDSTVCLHVPNDVSQIRPADRCSEDALADCETRSCIPC